jgi:CO/xanthine dehydrogenase Mo-binding subunit
VTFDETRVTSVDWGAYPILRFNGVPDTLDVHVIDRPGQPFLGTGEASQGPAAAALANAVADAIGVRFRQLPLSRARIRNSATAT